MEGRGGLHGEEGGSGGLILVIKMLMHYLRRQTFGFNERDSKMKRSLLELLKTWKMRAQASS